MNEALQRQLQMNIDAFSANVTAIVQQAVRDAVEAALKASAPAASSTARTAGKTAAATTPVVVAGKRPTSGRGSSVDVETVLAEVKREGGRGVEALAKSLRVKTKQLQLPLRKLVDTKKIKTKGQRRGMRYTAA
jgi:hypothetical protein